HAGEHEYQDFRTHNLTRAIGESQRNLRIQKEFRISLLDTTILSVLKTSQVQVTGDSRGWLLGVFPIRLSSRLCSTAEFYLVFSRLIHAIPPVLLASANVWAQVPWYKTPV